MIITKKSSDGEKKKNHKHKKGSCLLPCSGFKLAHKILNRTAIFLITLCLVNENRSFATHKMLNNRLRTQPVIVNFPYKRREN